MRKRRRSRSCCRPRLPWTIEEGIMSLDEVVPVQGVFKTLIGVEHRETLTLASVCCCCCSNSLSETTLRADEFCPCPPTLPPPIPPPTSPMGVPVGPAAVPPAAEADEDAVVLYAGLVMNEPVSLPTVLSTSETVDSTLDILEASTCWCWKRAYTSVGRGNEYTQDRRTRSERAVDWTRASGV